MQNSNWRKPICRNWKVHELKIMSMSSGTILIDMLPDRI